MDSLDAWFPYPDYRPHQREMLELCARHARDGGVVMIDAPTGSGKSSVVSALLAERSGRKVVVAVRTISQLNTFIRELHLIRGRQHGLRTAYLIGKRTMCPVGGEGDVYRRCEGLKSFSTSLMRERAEKGSLVPSKDSVILQQIRKMDHENPLICPYFVNSRIFIHDEETGLKMIPSTPLRSKADRVSSQCIWPGELREISAGVCPYEMMTYAAQNANVVIVNYHHLFNDAIREQLYINLGTDPAGVILLLDEGHNCGEVMQSVQSVVLGEGVIEQASREMTTLRRNLKGIEAVQHLLPRITEFMKGLKYSDETEDWFDSGIFNKMMIKGSLYPDISAIVEDLMRISEYIREKNIKAGEFRETAIEHLTEFLFRLSQSSTDPAYLTVFRKDGDELLLEVRNIDPATKLRDLAESHHCTVLISGTFSPVGSYQKLFFEDLPVSTLSMPNAFPSKNRLLLCAGDITTAFSMRQEKENTARIVEYIRMFSMLKGNLAVYFPSYQILETYARALGPALAKRNLFVEPKNPKEAGDALKEFLSLPSRGTSGVIFAVAGGKWSEGLDYRGDLLAGAMVVGLPLAPYNRVRRMVIEYFRRKFGDEGEFLSYTLPGVHKAVQALGRVLRTPDDRGVLIFGERRFLDQEVRQGLPEWMRKEMVACDRDSCRKELAAWKV
jgi:DNA excision repair protein ERCC-2